MTKSTTQPPRVIKCGLDFGTRTPAADLPKRCACTNQPCRYVLRSSPNRFRVTRRLATRPMWTGTVAQLPSLKTRPSRKARWPAGPKDSHNPMRTLAECKTRHEQDGGEVKQQNRDGRVHHQPGSRRRAQRLLIHDRCRRLVL